MRLKVVCLFALLVLGALLASPVLATPNTKLDLVTDCSAGCPEALDMAGPMAGFVNFNQDDTGALRVVVAVKKGVPDTTYEIFLVCGPTHALACGFISIGTLTTNGQGNGNSGAISVSVATLVAAPFGSGARTDHIDLLVGVGDLSAGVLAASVLEYTVP